MKQITTISEMNETAVFDRKLLQQAYSTFSFQQRPSVLLTLTVKEPKGKHGHWLVSDDVLLRKTNMLIHWINSELFGRKYRKNGKGLKAFGSIEKQSNLQPHIHFAITNRMPPKQFLKFKKILLEKIRKIKLFEEHGVDVQLIGSSDADAWRVGQYIAKDGRMLTLGPEGIA